MTLKESHLRCGSLKEKSSEDLGIIFYSSLSFKMWTTAIALLQSRPTKLTDDLEHISYSERSEFLNLRTIKERGILTIT